jgi:glycosyltransferase involved in cell wall biosynthesis
MKSLTTAVIVGFNTQKLTDQAVRSLRTLYLELPMIVVDNGSQDGSIASLAKLAKECKITPLYNKVNIGHGPALHQAILLADTPLILMFDSDCVANRAGFIEAMWAQLEADELMYATGWKRWVDRISGVPLEWFVSTPPDLTQFCPYVHPCCGLYKRSTYLKLPPAIHHGAPLLENMRAAVDQGYRLGEFAFSEYVTHLVAGTRRRYSGRWDPSAHEKPGHWNANDRHPI